MREPEVLISADSHVMESPDLWRENLPRTMRDRAPSYDDLKEKNISAAHAGGNDPAARVGEMSVDGVSAEVLYPTIAMDQFGIREPAVQEACFRVYNDWLIAYCGHAPQRLVGVACISVYDIDRAIAELERCRNAGLRGALIWQVPPPELSFASGHYDRFWSAAQDLRMPVSLHILTGAPYGPGVTHALTRRASGLELLHFAVNTKLLHVTDALLDIIASGVLERFPELKLVLVENEVSWLPFAISQWDKYCARGGIFSTATTLLPSEYFKRQVYATFFNDAPIRWFLQEWGADNCMWSNDFPHPNSTWPKSREVIARDLGHLTGDVRAKVTRRNVAALYAIPVEKLVEA